MNTPKYRPPLDPMLQPWFDAIAADPDALEFFEERAAILEFDGGLTRVEAERAAKLETDAYLRQRQMKAATPPVRLDDQE